MDHQQLQQFARRWRDRAERARDEAERTDCMRLADRYEQVIALSEASRSSACRLTRTAEPPVA